MKLHSVRELYELRNVPSMRPRRGVVRIFEAHGQFGLCDATGQVWPVRLTGDLSIFQGTIGSVFKVEFQIVQDKLTNPAQATADVMTVHLDSHAAGSSQAPWLTPIIPDPRLYRFQVDTTEGQTRTQFMRNPTSERFARLMDRVGAMEAARAFFKASGYHEFDSPTLVSSGGVERYLSTFQTEYTDHRLGRFVMQLPTSPEFALKKLVTEGCRRLYAMTHAFRNHGELSFQHEPEFLMLEWYRISECFESLMRETQKLVEWISTSFTLSEALPSGDWPRFNVSDLFEQLIGIELADMDTPERFREKASPKSPSIVDSDTWDDVFCKLFMDCIEPFLLQQRACFVTHYPANMGALAALNEHDSRFVDRFELYLKGVEICNGYRELIDGTQYKERVSSTRLSRPDVLDDPLFENCFAVGLYPCVGNALGLDRLISVLMGPLPLQETVPWPFVSRFPAESIAIE